jgi:hypothetical protein
LRLLSALLLACTISAPTWGGFDLTINVPTPGSFTPTQYTNLTNALDAAEALWERAITGYQVGINLTGVSINVIAGSGFAEASFPTTVNQWGYVLATSSTISVNPAVIDMYASWTGEGPPNPNPAYIGLNYLDDILAHEIGHALGIGPLWEPNGVYTTGSGQYTGEYGVRAYRAEFDAAATFVPVELAGNLGTIGLHWNQLMRSSSQEGNPSDPWSLAPLTGITDSQGRDLAMELLTGALDPDFGEPFLSHTTVQSLRDLGFTVVPEPSGAVLLFVAMAVGCRRRLRL